MGATFPEASALRGLLFVLGLFFVGRGRFAVAEVGAIEMRRTFAKAAA